MDHVRIKGGRQGREPPFTEPLLCARHTLGVYLSFIIPIPQMRKNAQKFK